MLSTVYVQIRLSVNSRTDPPFSMIEFNQLDSPREACAVCYLDMTAEPDRWHEAVRLAVKEVRRYVYTLSVFDCVTSSCTILP
jgi:hypothetical protein